MKKLLMIATLATLSLAAQAQIQNSDLEPRLQSLIETAISDACGLNGEITQVSNQVTLKPVDNGVTDREFVTVLEVRTRFEQNIHETSTVTVVSDYADMYDHSSQNWGAYSVSQVTCK